MRNQIVDAGLIVNALFAIPAVILSLLRAMDIGWRIVMYVRIAFVSIACIAAILASILAIGSAAATIVGRSLIHGIDANVHSVSPSSWLNTPVISST